MAAKRGPKPIDHYINVPMPPETALGPAMAALNDRQRAFVVSYCVLGRGATAAARAAGYGKESPDGLRVQAYRLIHDERVQVAIVEESRKRLKGMTPAALQAVEEIVNSPTHKERLKASLAVLNRSGLHEVAERKETVEIKLTKTEEIARIRVLAAQLGLDAEKLLGQCVDVEFEEVAPPSEATPTDDDGEPW